MKFIFITYDSSYQSKISFNRFLFTIYVKIRYFFFFFWKSLETFYTQQIRLNEKLID